MKHRSVIVVLILLILLSACGRKEAAIVLPQKEEEKVSVTTDDMDRLFWDLAASGERTNETLERMKEENREFLLRYLMTDFIAGKLEGCTYQDGSAEYLKFCTWDSLLEGETMPLETETPQEYWLQWCELSERTCGTEDMPVSSLYMELLERPLPLSAEELDALFEELAQSGQRTNETLQLVKAREPEHLFDYLVMEFLDGELVGCQLADGSVGTLKFGAWNLGMEAIESPVVSPQQYWEEWSAHARMLYERNGYDALMELGNPLAARCGKLMEERLCGLPLAPPGLVVECE